MKTFKDIVLESKISKIEEFLKLKKREDQEKWILKNLYPYKTMKPRKTKYGYNLSPGHDRKWLVEFSTELNHVYPSDFGIPDEQLGQRIDFPQAFFIYQGKYQEPFREVWLEEFFEEWLTQYERGW